MKWANGFDSNKLQTSGQSKKVIDFQTFLDTNPNEWKYDQEYQTDVSFQGLGNPVTHNACVDCGTKKPNEDFLCYKCNQKSKITSHYFPILQLGTPSCKKVFNGNNLVGEQIFNMPANDFGEKVFQQLNFVDAFVQEKCIGRWHRIIFLDRKNPRSKESIYCVSHFEFLSNEEAAKNTLLSTPSATPVSSPIECDLQTQMDRLFGWHAKFPQSRHTTTSSINAFLRKHGGHFDVTMLLQKCANVELDIDIFQELISRILHVTNPNDHVDVLMAHRSNFPFPKLETFLDGMTGRCMNELIPTVAPPVTPSPQTPNTPAHPNSKISVIPFELPSDDNGKEKDTVIGLSKECKTVFNEACTIP